MLLAAALTAGLIGSSALAQDSVAHELSIARCVVDNDAAGVRATLHSVAGSPREARVSKTLVELYGACDDNRSATGVISWRERATIAHEAALDALEKGRADIIAASTAPAWTAMPDAKAKAGRDYDSQAAGMLQVGLCTVRAAPEASRALLQSQPGSAAELTATQALSPALQGCIPGGQQFKMKRADLRLVVAEPMYEFLTAGTAGAQR